MHADLDAFYASVEQRDDPNLRGRPVIVGGGVVLASSYEAQAFGVRTAMGGAQARRLCPRAIVVKPRFEAYSEASKAVYGVFEQTSPQVEGLSIDEAFLEVRGMEHIFGSPRHIAARLRRQVLEQVGLPITVGVARTKFLAKVASGVAKPDGLLVVEPDRELEFLHPLPVERLWGVGDITGIWQLTHVGKYQGEVVAANILGESREANYDAVPRVVFTDPAAASVGASDAPFSGTAPLREIAKTETYTRAYADSIGFLTLLSDGTRLTGAYALGPEAGEWLQQATLAIRAQVPLDVLRDTIQPFPTFSEIYVEALHRLRTAIAADRRTAEAAM